MSLNPRERTEKALLVENSLADVSLTLETQTNARNLSRLPVVSDEELAVGFPSLRPCRLSVTTLPSDTSGHR